MEQNKQSFNISWKACFRIGFSIFLLFLALTYWKPLMGVVLRLLSAATPVFIGIGIAYVVNILMEFYESHFFVKKDNKFIKKIRRPICLLGALATGAGIVVIILLIVMPQLIDAISVISDNIPTLFKKMANDEKLMRLLPDSLADSVRNLNINNFITEAFKFLQGGIPATDGNSLVSTISTLSSKFMSAFLGFIFAIYILLGKEKLKSQFGRFFNAYTGRKFREKVHPILVVANSSFHAYIVGQVTEAVIIGVLCAVGLKIFGFPYSPMIGSVVGLTALIPVLGAYIGGIVGALMIASIAPTRVIPFIIYLVCLQQIEGNLIYPRVVGTSLGLPGIWVLFAVTVGGSVGGIGGMLFAVPIFTTIYRLTGEYVRKSEANNDSETEAEKLMNKVRGEEIKQ